MERGRLADRRDMSNGGAAAGRARGVAGGLVIGLAGVWALVIGVVFAWRIGFPLELEWMEGGALHQALRVQEGLGVYGAPSVDFVPFLYPPLYPALLAALGWALPLGYALGRAVSVAAVVGVAVALWQAAGQEGKPRAHRAAAAGLFLAGYVFTFRWYDLARADSLMLALVIGSLVVLRGAGAGWRRPVVAGLLAAAAFWTKQTAAVLIVAGGAAALAAAPRRMLRPVAIEAGVVAALVLGGLWAGSASTDGWLWTYLFELHQDHAFNHERFTRKTWGMFAHAAPFVAAALMVALGTWLKRHVGRAAAGEGDERGPSGEALRYWGVLAVAGLAVSALGYSTQWAEPNAFMPGVALGAALVAVSLPVGGRAEAVGLGLCAAQLLFALAVEPAYQPIQDAGWGVEPLRRSYRWQDPWRTLPRPEAWARAAALRRELAASAGEVLALHRPWWSVLAGGRGHVGAMGLRDVAAVDQARLRGELRRRVAAGEYAAIWLEGEPPGWLRGALVGRYRLVRRLEGEARVLPLSGYMSEAGMVTPYRGDQRLYVRREAGEAAAGE